MKTKTITVYSIKELAPEAQEKARQAFIADDDYSFLEDDMNWKLEELLKDNRIKIVDNAKVYYSLSYCQGDGAMFEGDYEWNGYSVHIKHSGHYYRSNCKDLDIVDEEGNETETDEPHVAFEAIYQKICKELEKFGYDVVEQYESMENFIETCEANDYTFTLSGKMESL